MEHPQITAEIRTWVEVAEMLELVVWGEVRLVIIRTRCWRLKDSLLFHLKNLFGSVKFFWEEDREGMWWSVRESLSRK